MQSTLHWHVKFIVPVAMYINSISISHNASGLPKAAVITHLQTLKAAAGFWAFGGREDDVVYTPLPLYHSAASMIGIGGTLQLGRRPSQVQCLCLGLLIHSEDLTAQTEETWRGNTEEPSLLPVMVRSAIGAKWGTSNDGIKKFNIGSVRLRSLKVVDWY